MLNFGSIKSYTLLLIINLKIRYNFKYKIASKSKYIFARLCVCFQDEFIDLGLLKKGKIYIIQFKLLESDITNMTRSIKLK